VLPLERRDQLAALLTDQGSRHRATRRKNALFAGRESGARTWAILASLINTAKLNDLDPQTYLADVLERMISGRTPVSRLDELLAWHWKAARDALATAAA
jgi:sulfite reductase alpha subunit-like flavoprotein